MRNKILTIGVFLSVLGITTAQTSDKAIKFGGRIMYDMAIWGTEEMNNAGTEFRRARIYSAGNLYENVQYKLQLDFAGGKVAFKDVYIELNSLPLLKGSLRVGNFKEPLRLESLTSSKYMTFMERALPIAFAPERNSGAMYQTQLGDKLSLQTGVFRNGDSFGNNKASNGNVNITSRVTYLAIQEADRWLHLGMSNSIRKNAEKSFAISAAPENHFGTEFATAEFENMEEMNILAGECVYTVGAISLQGEYLQSSVIGTTETNLSSYYGQISYFITGESRTLKHSYEGMNKITPNKNYGKDGLGAIELAMRLSNMDLTASENGNLDDITLGVNWYLNPNTRVMFNYVMSEYTDNDETIHSENAAMMRVQVDF